MNTKQILNKENALKLASNEFDRTQLWRWKTGKTIPDPQNAAKLAKCLGYELDLNQNGSFEYRSAK